MVILEDSCLVRVLSRDVLVTVGILENPGANDLQFSAVINSKDRKSQASHVDPH